MTQKVFRSSAISDLLKDIVPESDGSSGVQVYLNPNAFSPGTKEFGLEEEFLAHGDDEERSPELLMDEDRDEEDNFDWWGHEIKLVKADPMRHRDQVYLQMLRSLVADGTTLMGGDLRDNSYVKIVQERGWDNLSTRGQIIMLLRFMGGFSKPGIYTQEWFSYPGDPFPPHAGADFELERDNEVTPISELQKFIGENFGSAVIDRGALGEGEIADRMYGWSDLEQAWVGAPNHSDWEDDRPNNWVRHWVVNFGPPILIDPHYVMHMRGTPLAPPQRKALFEIKKDGRRWYVAKGPSFELKGWIKARGMKWDAVGKRWWTGSKEIAEAVAAGPFEDTTPGSWEFYIEHFPPSLGIGEVSGGRVVNPFPST